VLAWLPLCLMALLLLLQPGAAPRRTTPPLLPADPATAPLLAMPSPPPAATAQPPSPLFADIDGMRPLPVAVATAPPPELLQERQLLDAVAAALPVLGGEVAVDWGAPTAVGPVLRVSWQPEGPLDDLQAVQGAVSAVVATVVDAMDRAFPAGFRARQGAPLAAVQVDLPGQDSVLVAVRSYRELVAGAASPEQFTGEWRLLRREGEDPAAPKPADARLVPEASATGAPQRWPPRIARFYTAILKAAVTYQIDPALLAAIMQQESGGEPDAVGPWAWIPHMGRYERAIGLMQVMPNEAERRGVAIDDAWDPETNILLGARILRDKLNGVPGDFWTRVQGYYGFGDPLSDYWLERVYAYWLAFRAPAPAP